VVGFFVLEALLFLGTAVYRNPSHDHGQGDSQKTCSAEQPSGYECVLETLCRRPEGCLQPPGRPFLCCKSSSSAVTGTTSDATGRSRH
jgi:hypothetical protein